MHLLISTTIVFKSIVVATFNFLCLFNLDIVSYIIALNLVYVVHLFTV